MIQTFVCASGVENTILATSWDAAEPFHPRLERLQGYNMGFHHQNLFSTMLSRPKAVDHKIAL
tara:strand:- start:329 stop:517 length:189 start_codon:yes stop_codon:yes gene_type:complete